MKYLLIGALLCAPVAHAEGQAIEPVLATAKRSDKMRKLQVLNRVFQIVLGRGMKKEEAKQMLALKRDEIKGRFLASPEAREVFAERLVAYTAQPLPTAAKSAAEPTKKLGEVLATLGKNRHKGVQCGDGKSNASCFGRWLVGHVAPTLGGTWAEAQSAKIEAWSYAELLEAVIDAGT